MNKIIFSIITLISVFSIFAAILTWAANLWLTYFSWPEITYWHSLALFVFVLIVVLIIKVFKNFLNEN